MMSEIKTAIDGITIAEIEIPYIGSVLSVNHCCYGGGYGRKLKAEAKTWKAQLAGLASNLPPAMRKPGPLVINLYGRFRSKAKTPDLHNLHKLIADGIAEGLRIDDVDFRFVDMGYEIDRRKPPMLFIKVGHL